MLTLNEFLEIHDIVYRELSNDKQKRLILELTVASISSAHELLSKQVSDFVSDVDKYTFELMLREKIVDILRLARYYRTDPEAIIGEAFAIFEHAEAILGCPVRVPDEWLEPL